MKNFGYQRNLQDNKFIYSQNFQSLFSYKSRFQFVHFLFLFGIKKKKTEPKVKRKSLNIINQNPRKESRAHQKDNRHRLRFSYPDFHGGSLPSHLSFVGFGQLFVIFAMLQIFFDSQRVKGYRFVFLLNKNWY